MAEITLEQQIACVERELGMREKVYPRWVNKHPPKMTPKTAEHELAAMRAVRESLIALRSQRDGAAP